MSNITHDYIEDYLKSFDDGLDGKLGNIEETAKEQNIPVIKHTVRDLIGILLTMKKPKHVLEFGLAVGYSAAFMSEYIDGKVYSFERNPKMYEKAFKNLKKLSLDDKVEVIIGDALENFDKINQKFDVVFIDAAKSKYKEFLDLSEPYLNDGALIICDNVLNKGMIAKNIDNINRRHRTTHRNMREFLRYIKDDKRFETVIMPVSDGVSLSIYKGGKK